MSFALAPILAACREVCEGVIGSVETVPVGALEPGAYADAERREHSAAALVVPRYEVEVVSINETTLAPKLSSHKSLEVELMTRLIYATDFEIDAAARERVRVEACELGERVRAALTRPGNLTQTSAAVATGISSGALFGSKSSVKDEGFSDRVYVIEISARALVCTERG